MKIDKVKERAVWCIVAGIALIVLRFRLDTGISYGFVMGENEGITNFLSTWIITGFVGKNLLVDLFFDPLGYVLIFVGFKIIGSGKFASNGKLMAAVGGVSYLLQMLLPFVIEPKNMILPINLAYVLQILSVVVIIYALAGIFSSRVDDYTFANVGKDLRFSADLLGVCLVVEKILLMFAKVDWYFADILYYAVVALSIAITGYFAYKTIKYMYVMDIFVEKEC